MSRGSKTQASFNGGELTPRLAGRTDEAVYFIGVEEMLGFLPVLQGPAVAAPGTVFVSPAKGPHRLIPFEYNVTQGYQIEASAGTFRFYTNDVRIETSPGVPYEVGHNWNYQQLLQLDYVQSADVLYLVGAGLSPRTLSRTGAASFVWDGYGIEGGPFEEDNSNDSITVSASGTTGSVTITATAPIFHDGDAGGLFKIEARDFADIPAWEPGIATTAGSRRRSDGKVYQSVGGTRTGSQPPVHSRGVEWDGSSAGQDVNSKGPYGVPWQFLYGPSGHIRISSVAGDGLSCVGNVIEALADSVVSGSTSIWAFGAFSDHRGWPDAITIWNERMVLAKGNRLFGSVVGGYNDFTERDSSGNAQRDLAFRARLPDPNPVRWLAADRKLLIGTARAEYVAEQLIVQSDAAGPPPIQIDRQSSRGSLSTKPVLASGRVLFIQRAGRKLLELGYAVQSDRYEAPDLTRFAEHIGLPGFVEMAWQQEPEALLWTVRADGTLASMTYSAEEQVHGWARRRLGGGMEAKTVSVISDQTGERDQLWIGARHGDDYWVLRQQKIWETGDDARDAFLIDAGLSYVGTATKNGSGADHLIGKTVAVLADGKPHRDIVIGAGGTWSLDYQATHVNLGYAFPARMTTLPIEVGGDDGTAQGKVKRISAVSLRLLETQGIRVSVQDGEPQAVETRVPDDAMDQAVPLFTGDIKLDTVGNYERFGKVTIERFQPTPVTVLAVIPTVQTSPR